MNRTRHLSIAAVLVVVTTVVVYLLISGQFIGFGLLELSLASSEEAIVIDNLMQGHMILMAFLFAIIVAPSFYAFLVFRRREGDEEDAEHIHGNTTVEIIWTVAPLILVIIFGFWGVDAYNNVIAAEEDSGIGRAVGCRRPQQGGDLVEACRVRMRKVHAGDVERDARPF